MSSKFTFFNAFVVFILLMIVSNLSFAFNSDDRISFGLETVTWLYMYDDGKELKENVSMGKRQKELWEFAEYNQKKIRDIGGQWNIVVLDQKRMSGYSSMSRKKKIAKIIEKHYDLGLDCIFRIRLDPYVYNLDDLNDAPTVESRNFLKTLLEEISVYYDKGVKAILIGNELNGNLQIEGKQFQISYDAYKTILNFCYNIIKSTDPRIMVGDHGAASHLLAHAYIYDLLNSNRVDEAYTFWKDFMTVPGKKPYFSMAQFKQSISRSTIKQQVEFVIDSMNDPGKADFFQLHHYRSWKTVSPLIQWVREKLYEVHSIRPIYACEIGYLMPLKKNLFYKSTVTQDMDLFSEEDQALELIKTMVSFLGNGVNNALYWQIRWNTNEGWVGRLFQSTENPTEFRPLLAEGSFSLLAKSLNGLKAIPEKRFKIAGILEYFFTGKDKISIIWSKKGKILIPLSKLQPEIVTAINLIDKKPINLNQTYMSIDTTPVLVTWK